MKLKFIWTQKSIQLKLGTRERAWGGEVGRYSPHHTQSAERLRQYGCEHHVLYFHGLKSFFTLFFLKVSDTINTLIAEKLHGKQKVFAERKKHPKVARLFYSFK